jgi:hypothetical protein
VPLKQLGRRFVYSRPLDVITGPTFDQTTTINTSLSNGNLSAAHTNITPGGVRVTTFHSAGKFYWRVTNSVAIASSDCIGFQTVSGAVTDQNAVPGVIVLLGTVTTLYANNVDQVLNFGTKVVNDVWEIATDFGANLTWFRRNSGSWNTNGSADPATGVGGISFTGGSYTPYVRFSNQATDTFTINLSAAPAPSGFGSW